MYLSNQTSIRNMIQSHINDWSIILGMAFIHNYYKYIILLLVITMNIYFLLLLL